MSRDAIIRRPPIIGVAMTVAGCFGSIDGAPTESPAPTQSNEPRVTPGPGAAAPRLPGVAVPTPLPSPQAGRIGLSPARLWLLSPLQYKNVVEQAIGTSVDLSAIEVTERFDSFINPADGGLAVDDAFFASLDESATIIVAEHAPRLAMRLACPLDALTRSCLQGFIEPFGRAVFRTPEADVSPYLDLYDRLRTRLPAAFAFEGVIEALLLSPKALFRFELGDRTRADRGPVRLTHGELAESLALTIWNRGPDDELMRVAADGRLHDPAVLRQQVTRMLGAGSRGRAGMLQLLAEWLGIATFAGVEKNPTDFPSFTDALKGSMANEHRRFADHVLTKRKGSLVDLLTLPESFIDARLAAVYGVPATDIVSGTPTLLPKDQRAGAFTLPGVIAAISEPTLTGVVYRGKVLLERLLCREVHSPDMDVELPDPQQVGLPRTATTRQRLETLEKEAACRGCHVLLHPMAFAMESYDAMGRFRTHENGTPIDGSGALAFTQAASTPFRSAVEMFGVLARSEEVYTCFTRQAFRYVYGRREDDGRDEQLLAEAGARLRADALDIRSLFRTLILNDAFTHRERR